MDDCHDIEKALYDMAFRADESSEKTIREAIDYIRRLKTRIDWLSGQLEVTKAERNDLRYSLDELRKVFCKN